MNECKRWFWLMSISLLVLTASMMGGAFGCGGGDGGDEGETEKVSYSKTYSLDRASNGASFDTLTSSEGTYKIDATLGGHLSKGKALSRQYHYLIRHALGRQAVEEETSE